MVASNANESPRTTVEKTSGLPPVKTLSGSFNVLSTRISTPKRSIEVACLT